MKTILKGLLVGLAAILLLSSCSNFYNDRDTLNNFIKVNAINELKVVECEPNETVRFDIKYVNANTNRNERLLFTFACTKKYSFEKNDKTYFLIIEERQQKKDLVYSTYHDGMIEYDGTDTNVISYFRGGN